MSRAVVLTGGIGSGKSAVGRLLAERGAHVVDADQLAREVVAPGTDGLTAVVHEFGPSVLTADEVLDRAALADLVFDRPDRLAALEAIIHPRVQALAAQRLAAGSDAPVVVYEVPLPHRDPPFGGDTARVIVVVDAPEDLRRTRLAERGLASEQIEARLARQPTREEWVALADWVIDNSGTLEALEGEVERLWHHLTDPPDRDLTGAGPAVGSSG